MPLPGTGSNDDLSEVTPFTISARLNETLNVTVPVPVYLIAKITSSSAGHAQVAVRQRLQLV